MKWRKRSLALLLFTVAVAYVCIMINNDSGSASNNRLHTSQFSELHSSLKFEIVNDQSEVGVQRTPPAATQIATHVSEPQPTADDSTLKDDCRSSHDIPKLPPVDCKRYGWEPRDAAKKKPKIFYGMLVSGQPDILEVSALAGPAPCASKNPFEPPCVFEARYSQL